MKTTVLFLGLLLLASPLLADCESSGGSCRYGGVGRGSDAGCNTSACPGACSREYDLPQYCSVDLTLNCPISPRCSADSDCPGCTPPPPPSSPSTPASPGTCLHNNACGLAGCTSDDMAAGPGVCPCISCPSPVSPPSPSTPPPTSCNPDGTAPCDAFGLGCCSCCNVLGVCTTCPGPPSPPPPPPSGPPPPPPPPPVSIYTITGIALTKETSSPLGNVVIDIQNIDNSITMRTATLADGTFSITMPSIPRIYFVKVVNGRTEHVVPGQKVVNVGATAPPPITFTISGVSARVLVTGIANGTFVLVTPSVAYPLSAVPSSTQANYFPGTIGDDKMTTVSVPPGGTYFVQCWIPITKHGNTTFFKLGNANQVGSGILSANQTYTVNCP